MSGGAGDGSRSLRTRVKTAKGRKISSTRWLARQLNDPYVQKARREGYRSRAAYKLLEIDEKRGLLKPGMRVVDLGCAPGGWLQVAVKATNALGERKNQPQGVVVGIDILEFDAVPGSTALLGDFLEDEAEKKLRASIDGPVDLVLSDMAAFASGHRATDHLRIIALCEHAAEFAYDVLAPGGGFVAKVLQGGAEGGLLATLKKRFTKVAHVKPPASRKDSAEMYVVATGFRGDREG